MLLHPHRGAQAATVKLAEKAEKAEKALRMFPGAFWKRSVHHLIPGDILPGLG